MRIPLPFRLTSFGLLACFALAASSFAQTNPQTVGSGPRNRITSQIVDAESVSIPGNTHPFARAEFDRGELPGETRLDRLVLVLKPDARQQRSLDALTEAQQEPASPEYQRWLTPQQYGQRFGVSSADLARLTGWLQSHGFSVEPIPAGRRLIVFSGTAGQVAEAFHTQLHRYQVAGQMHIANVQDPEIPKALAPVVEGILSLHDFRRVSALHTLSAIAHPENTQGGTHYLFPADFATIYNLNPQYAAGQNGTGSSIAIVGRSNINLSDISSFRSTSGLAAKAPTVILDGANPGLISGDQDEATLDVEWSGAVAPAATVKFVVAASTGTSDGVDLSAQYIVNNKTAPVMSTSFGNCESNMGSAELAFYNSLWQQAASEGISSFVSSGDSGAAGCNGGSSSSGSRAGVNGLCSSPYSTCVGGTEFNEGSSGAYWGATNGAGGGSALGYIPEKVWNESGNSGGSGLWSSGGGISLAYTQPTWQQGVPGANSNGMRAVPDLSLTAASHDGYLVCLNGNWYVFGGTSASSPSMAGIFAVLEQKLQSTGLGNANPALYGMLSASVDPFHATPTGNNTVPGVSGFTASGTAYNLATGLGSVDANLLVNNWPTSGGGPTQNFTLTPSTTALTAAQGKTATFTVAIAGTGGFTGSVALSVTSPSGVSISFLPSTVKAGSSSTATVVVSGSAAAGTSAITITGVSGSITQTATVNLTVAAAPKLSLVASSNALSLAQGKSATLTFTTTTTGAFSDTVTLSIAGLPTGVTAAWTNNPFAAKGAVTVSSVLTLKAATTAMLNTAALTITATGGGQTAKTQVTLQVAKAPSVTLSLSTTRISMTSTATQQVTVTLTPQGGIAPAAGLAGVSFQVTGMPTGITAQWASPTLAPSGAVQAVLSLVGSKSAISSSTQLTFTGSLVDATTGVRYVSAEQTGLTVTRAVIAKRP